MTFAQPFQDYEILDRVGGGAMGTVFKARHKRLNRIVALKVLKPSLARDKRYVERLRREARIVASLSHPHIVTGYDLGEESGYHFFVMEFVEGKSLRQLLVEWGMFAEDYVLDVARQVAEALDHAYQRDVIHRDIKPGNILIDDKGQVKLTDMGLAKGPADMTLTRDGATVGTPMYISPEQARNPQDVDVRSDLYSLGATLYHMATGTPPFSGDTMAELITNVLNEQVVPPDAANSAVSEGTSLVIRKLLAKNLSLRYQTPRELLDDLDRIARSQAPAVDVGRLEADGRDERWLRPVLLVTVVLALTLGAWWVGRQMVERGDVAPDPDTYFAALDSQLLALPTAGARYVHLQSVADAPTGSAQGLERRRRELAAELQQLVDGVAEELGVARWPELREWLHAPRHWPDVAMFEREWLEPRLRKALGIAVADLPTRVRMTRVEELGAAVQRELVERDGELESRFDRYLQVEVPARADDKLRLGDFAAVERLWSTASALFFDGVAQPLPERLALAVKRRVDGALEAARRAGMATLVRAEQQVHDALRDEVAAVSDELGRRLAQQADPELVSVALQKLRRDLVEYWPPATAFRAGSGPWPFVEQRLQALHHAIEQRRRERAAARVTARCALAWRAFVHGDARAAAAVLDELAPVVESDEPLLRRHRRVLAAADRVEQAVLEVIRSRAEPTVAFPVVSLEPVTLRVVPDGERLSLLGAPVAASSRVVRLTELRLADLLRLVDAERALALRQLPEQQRALGTIVLRMCSEDYDDLERDVLLLPASDRQFVLEVVWPLLERARSTRGGVAIDRDALFAELDRVLRGLEQGGSQSELEVVLLKLEGAQAERDCSAKQLRLLRVARERFRLSQRRRELAGELERSAPSGAVVRVTVADAELLATATLSADVLRRDARAGWQPRGELLEFAGGARSWASQAMVALRADAGLRGGELSSQLELELVFPPAAVGRRQYLITFRGVAVALVLTASDGVHAALVRGALEHDGGLDQDRAERALTAAMSAELAPRRAALAIPGGRHRLRIDVRPTRAATQALVVVSFEDEVLLRQPIDFDREQPVAFAVHPLQEVSVARAVVSERGP